MKLTGRIGRAPSFRTTAGGKLVAKFPLALHNEDGRLGKGHEVDVTGYKHEREYKGRDGTPKTAQEIYSVAVIRR
ncbi:single-stranded DNA-binding protein [Kitasatospora griseola]|uniref:single-stranded DNA-binding protein n=1 Tax=Kitasatospora griseola TaxID=2064 RepID=UPI003809076E